MMLRSDQRHKESSSPDSQLPDKASPLAQLLDAERDESSLLQHLRRVHDPKGLQTLRRVRQRIAYWREQLHARPPQP